MGRRRYFACIVATCISESRRRSEAAMKKRIPSTDYTDYSERNLCNLWMVLLVLFVLALAPGSSPAQRIVDRMVATVNAGVRTDLITHSDLMWQLALQPNTQLDNPTAEDLNRALRLLIDQRLILQEAEKIPTIVPTQKEVSDARDDLARNFPSPLEFQQRLQRVGLITEKLDEIIEQRLKMEKYLDFRFRNFVVISQKEIADYYRDVYVPRFQSRSPGRIVPTLEQARAEIERTLMEAKIESDTNAFLETARERAEIVTLSPV